MCDPEKCLFNKTYEHNTFFDNVNNPQFSNIATTILVQKSRLKYCSLFRIFELSKK